MADPQTNPPASVPAPPPASAVTVEKSFLVQRFAKLSFGSPAAFSVVGYSAAGEETVVQVPEMNVCFDVGRSPHFALTSDIVCVSHGHMDHIAGLGYYLSQRVFQGMQPGKVLVPRELHRATERLLSAWRDVERQDTPGEVVPMEPGQLLEVRRDFGIRAVATHHGQGSLGYTVLSIREKLKAEYTGLPGPQLAQMKKDGVAIQYRVEVPMVSYLGDTSAGPATGNVFERPDVRNAMVLLTECTFFDQAHKAKAKVGKHMHVDQFANILPTLNNTHVVLLHVTRRTSVRRARQALRKLVGDEQMRRVHFLMDFDGAKDAGDIEDAGPPAAEG